MTELRCWRCQRKLAEADGTASGTITITCTRCGATNVMSLPAPLDTPRLRV